MQSTAAAAGSSTGATIGVMFGALLLLAPIPEGKTAAEETGGGYFELSRTDELNSTFTRVASELHSQYVLGFSPKVLDGKVHKLEVRITRPGLVARARKSYVAK